MLTLDEVRPGLALGRYECLLPIARGGMAAVWAARARGARGFQRIVAIKTMLPMLSTDPNFEAMFLDEARIVSRIRHPNVVEVIDLGEQDSLLYIVMEWIDGEPLSTLMRKASNDGRLPLGIAARIMADVCAGLHAAHELKNDDGAVVGLVHRDVSPQNVLVSYDGLVKLVDFGVAKAAGVSSVETGVGQIKGKLAYMAPEQVMGEKVDRRTDIFACGIVLYQVATGKHPFRGEHDAETINNVLYRDVPSPRQFLPDCPPQLASILMRALQREPDRRYQTAGEMAQELDELARQEGRRVTAEQVGAFATSVAGAIGAERRALLKSALSEADGRKSSTAAMLADSAEPVQLTPASGSVLIAGGPGPGVSITTPDTGQSAVSVSGQGAEASGISIASSPPSPRRARTPLVVAAIAGAIVPLAALAFVLATRGEPAETAQPAASALPGAASSTEAHPALALSVAPDTSAAHGGDILPVPSGSASASAAPPSASVTAPAPAGSRRPRGGSTGTSTTGGWVPPLKDPGF